MLKFPFEATEKELENTPDIYVDAIFSCLESEFLTMPKGAGFISYPVFESAYEVLKAATSGFMALTPEKILEVAFSHPMVLVVLRTMLGFTPPEWAYLTAQKTGFPLSQNAIRTLDRKARINPHTAFPDKGLTGDRIRAMVTTACLFLNEGVPEIPEEYLHRLDKADTRNGSESIRNLSRMGLPYAMLLYERFLGRPFAGHRDSVSELIGDGLESAIEAVLHKAGISFRKTGRAERIPGFDQAPDFIIPSEFNPQVIIEAKITEDDGTARDKVTRIQHLGQLSLKGVSGTESPRYEVIACIGGRGFGVRREDMKKMILATRGKVFTAKSLNQMVAHTRLKEFKTL